MEKLTILSGKNKDNFTEYFDRIDFYKNDIIAVVGPTGSGKTAFITDIELLAQNDTDTRRTILIDDTVINHKERNKLSHRLISVITQNTKCFTDLSVINFLKIHARSRKITNKGIVDDCINLANTFTGEKIVSEAMVTTLSGGQTRSLLIADSLLIGDSPILLLDEIENAGIYKNKLIGIIKNSNKIIFLVTHDPVIILSASKRLIIKNGGIEECITTTDEERKLFDTLINIDGIFLDIKESLRQAEYLN